MSSKTNSESEKAQPMVYQIRIEGHLGREWADWFEGLVELTSFGEQKIAVIKIVKEVLGLGLA